MSKSSLIYPVILSGGAGTRLWPLSREHYPKQLLPLVSDRSLIQETVLRFSEDPRFAAPLVVCSEAHRFLIAEQMRGIDTEPLGILLEPCGRDTAAAAGVAALFLSEVDPDAHMLVLPADHSIHDNVALADAVLGAAAIAGNTSLVTFGIQPTRPSTGYGYIRRGTAESESPAAYKVAEFVEKPDQDTAKGYVSDGEHYWNSGMFLFPVRRFLEELARFEPNILAACRASLERAARDLDFLRLDRDTFAAAPGTSIDYGVMERTAHAIVVPIDVGWSDVGSFTTLWELSDHDSEGNACQGDVITRDTSNSYIRADGMLTAVVGLENVIVVVTDDSVLVAAKDRAEQIKAVVAQLRQENREEATSHSRVYRPWGYYQSIHHGNRFQVKRLTIKPGARLSSQMHHHRAEHWIIVNGTAQVTRGDDIRLVFENESIYIPIGTTHSIENPGKVPLNLIEVQSGTYLGEDDIVRFNDVYGRVPSPSAADGAGS